MAENWFTNIKEWFGNLWKEDELSRDTEDESSWYNRRKKIVVFIVSFVLAFCLWLLVNLSRDFNLNVNLPIQIGNIPPDQAMADKLPEFVTVSINGEGWKLINIYNNPPQIFVDVTSGEVNLYDQIRQQMNALPNVNVIKVQPSVLSADLEPKERKTVPVNVRTNITFREQHDFLNSPEITPDSVTVIGAQSKIEPITAWETDVLEMKNVRDNINTIIPLNTPAELVSLSINEVQYTADVAEFTEGEVRTFVRSRDFPEGESVNYSPSVITVKYGVPIKEYVKAQDIIPYTAYVTYDQIKNDTTGFVKPFVTPTTDDLHIKLRSYQPQKVSYFKVVQR